MLIILDSNVFISALISDRGAPHVMFKAWRARRFEVVTCPEQLNELRRASHYAKLRSLIPAHTFGALLNHLQQAIILDHFPVKHEAEDPHDSYLLNLATASKADYLVTDDKRAGLVSRPRIAHARILDAACFCKTVLNQ